MNEWNVGRQQTTNPFAPGILFFLSYYDVFQQQTDDFIFTAPTQELFDL